ncbi:MAG: hypothetical protein P8130_07110 [Deltaproteobacteria bacterium]
MKKYRALAIFLPFCLTTVLMTACVTTEKMPEATENIPSAQTENAQQPAAAKMQPGNNQEPAPAAQAPETQQLPPSPPDPCAAKVAQLVEQARAHMKTVSGACQDQRIEVNPMWAKDYDGAVRVRTYDAVGKLKSMETINP